MSLVQVFVIYLSHDVMYFSKRKMIVKRTIIIYLFCRSKATLSALGIIHYVKEPSWAHCITERKNNYVKNYVLSLLYQVGLSSYQVGLSSYEVGHFSSLVGLMKGHVHLRKSIYKGAFIIL